MQAPGKVSDLEKSWQKQFALLLNIFAVVHINVLASYLGLIHDKKKPFYRQKITLNATKKLHTLCSTLIYNSQEYFNIYLR